MSVTAQPDPREEMQVYFENHGQSQQAESDPVTATDSPATTSPTTDPAATGTTTDPAAPTSTPATTATPTTDYWSEPADDDDLPPSLKGKPRREVWNALKPALSNAHFAGYQKNQAEAALEVERLVTQNLRRELERSRPAVQPAAPQQPYEHLLGPGVDPQSIYSDPVPVLNAIPQFVQAQVNQAMQGLQQQMARTSGETLAVRSDLAQSKARESLKLDDDTFNSIRPWLANIMAVNQADPTVPNNWILAANMFRQNAAKMIPSTQPVVPTPSPAGNGRPAATAAPAPRPANTTGSKHMDNALKPHLDAWNSDRSRRGLKLYTLAEFKDALYSDRIAGLGDE